MFAYEKGLIWGNDNYRTNGALVNVALATGNVGRPGGGCVRMGGHQEGYSRPSDAHVGRPAAYVDKLLIEGKGGVHHIWACDHYKTTLNALKFKQAYKKRTDLVKDAMSAVPYGDREGMVECHRGGDQEGRTVRGRCRHRADQDRSSLPRLAARGDLGRNEPHIDERRASDAAHRALHGPARPGHARLPDRGAHRQQHGARAPRDRARGKYADQFKGFDWKTEEDAFMDGYHNHEKGGEFVTYERLRAMGTNGFQEPATDFKDGKIIGTKRLFADGKFKSKDGKATFMETKWRGLQAPGKEAEMKKWPFLINNGRTNIVWQNAYLDQDNEFVMDRFPFAFIQMNPRDMDGAKVKAGDLVEVYNDNGSTQAIVYPTPTAKRKQTFMLFAYPTGVAGQRGIAGRERVHHPQLQADVGRDPQDRRRAGGGEIAHVQVAGIHGVISAARRAGSVG